MLLNGGGGASLQTPVVRRNRPLRNLLLVCDVCQFSALGFDKTKPFLGFRIYSLIIMSKQEKLRTVSK